MLYGQHMYTGRCHMLGIGRYPLAEKESELPNPNTLPENLDSTVQSMRSTIVSPLNIIRSTDSPSAQVLRAFCQSANVFTALGVLRVHRQLPLATVVPEYDKQVLFFNSDEQEQILRRLQYRHVLINIVWCINGPVLHKNEDLAHHGLFSVKLNFQSKHVRCIYRAFQNLTLSCAETESIRGYGIDRIINDAVLTKLVVALASRNGDTKFTILFDAGLMVTPIGVDEALNAPIVREDHVDYLNGPAIRKGRMKPYVYNKLVDAPKVNFTQDEMLSHPAFSFNRVYLFIHSYNGKISIKENLEVADQVLKSEFRSLFYLPVSAHPTQILEFCLQHEMLPCSKALEVPEFTKVNNNVSPDIVYLDNTAAAESNTLFAVACEGSSVYRTLYLPELSPHIGPELHAQSHTDNKSHAFATVQKDCTVAVRTQLFQDTVSFSTYHWVNHQGLAAKTRPDDTAFLGHWNVSLSIPTGKPGAHLLEQPTGTVITAELAFRQSLHIRRYELSVGASSHEFSIVLPHLHLMADDLSLNNDDNVDAAETNNMDLAEV